MTEQHDSIILHLLARAFMVPFILVFGSYVLVHGEASPGGGFQAGAIVAAAILLGRLTLGIELTGHRIPTRWLLLGASAGGFLYIVTGVIPLFFGANYLDYSAIPLEWFNAIAEHDRTNRAMGIFIVELGVFLTVVSVLVLLFDYLSLRFRDA